MNPRTLSNVLKFAFTGLTTLISVSIANPSYAQSSPNSVIAQMACSNANGVIVLRPEYYGRTRSGLDIWICVESGSGKEVFLMMNKGPYPVVACNRFECRVIDHTY